MKQSDSDTHDVLKAAQKAVNLHASGYWSHQRQPGAHYQWAPASTLSCSKEKTGCPRQLRAIAEHRKRNKKEKERHYS